MRTLTSVVPIFFAAACSSSSNNTTTDAPQGGGSSDAASGGGSDAPGGPTITVSGVATAQSLGPPTPAANVIIAAYANSDESTVVAMTTTDAKGNYTLVVPSSTPLDGYLKATSAPNADVPYSDTYLYPPVPLTADFANAAINMIPQSLFSTLSGVIGMAQPGQGVVALEVIDSLASMTFISGATVASDPPSNPPKISYDAQGSSTPSIVNSGGPTATGGDGRGFIFALDPGTYTVTAAKTGVTFKPTTVKVFANAFTTTLVTE